MAFDSAASTHWSNQLAPLSDERRRHALAVLVQRGALAVTDLAAAVLDRLGSFEADTKRVAIDLYHVHLPLLDDAGLVTFDAESRTAEPAESPIYESAPLETGDGLDVVDVFADERRRAVLDALVASDGSLGLDELARRVAADCRGQPVEAVADGERDQIATSLHHVHLPRLCDAGVVAYDRGVREATLADPLPAPVADGIEPGSDDGSEGGRPER